jgi:hypothetical protein
MIEQAVTISDFEIVIKTQFFVHKDYAVTGRELLLDIFSVRYSGQLVRVIAWDGENLQFSGFTTFIEYLCNQFNIPADKVIFESHNKEHLNFNTTQLLLGIFISVNRYLPAINTDLTGAKFTGTFLGRLNPTRLRLAYELDKKFPNDNFTIFQPVIQQVTQNYNHFTDIYSNELEWVKQKQFDKDMTSRHHSGMIDWEQSCAAYGNVWNKYQIEIISETDSMSNFWFTEKTARCLATGKPFILIAGKDSLAQLKAMGFETYGSFINESYDTETTPTRRISSALSSLNELYTNPNRHAIIEQMYQHSKHNINFYKEYIKSGKYQ